MIEVRGAEMSWSVCTTLDQTLGQMGTSQLNTGRGNFAMDYHPIEGGVV